MGKRDDSKSKPWRARCEDAVGLAGAAALGYGLWQVYPPLALVVVGLLFMAASALLGIARAREQAALAAERARRGG